MFFLPAKSREGKQGQVGQRGAPCGSSNECVTDRPTDQPTDQRTQPVIEVLCRT